MTHLNRASTLRYAPEYHENLGSVMCLLNQSSFHKGYLLWNLSIDIVPALRRGQLKLYFDSQQQPTGFVIWEWVNSRTIQHLVNVETTPHLGYCPRRDYLLITEFMATAGNAKAMIADIKSALFPRENIFCLSRYADGSIRKVHQWQGDQLRADTKALI
jgi:hemolysin-activating ACP:hemolysin acyltransferase